MILKEYLQQIKDRLERTTPGPWKWDFGNRQVESENDLSYRDGVCSLANSSRDGIYGRFNKINDSCDGEFIASCPTDISNLLAVISIYQEALEKFSSHVPRVDATMEEKIMNEIYSHESRQCLKAAEEVIKNTRQEEGEK